MNANNFLDNFTPPVAGNNEAAAAAQSPGKPKPEKRFCSVPGCKNGVVQGGLCVSHGAKRRKCKFPGCEKRLSTTQQSLQVMRPLHA